MISISVSVQTILASVQALVTGMKQVNDEIRHVQKLRTPLDRFVIVMQVVHRTTSILVRDR